MFSVHVDKSHFDLIETKLKWLVPFIRISIFLSFMYIIHFYIYIFYFPAPTHVKFLIIYLPISDIFNLHLTSFATITWNRLNFSISFTMNQSEISDNPESSAISDRRYLSWELQ